MSVCVCVGLCKWFYGSGSTKTCQDLLQLILVDSYCVTSDHCTCRKSPFKDVCVCVCVSGSFSG